MNFYTNFIIKFRFKCPKQFLWNRRCMIIYISFQSWNGQIHLNDEFMTLLVMYIVEWWEYALLLSFGKCRGAETYWDMGTWWNFLSHFWFLLFKLQGVPYWSVPFRLTEIDRNMQVIFVLKVTLEFWDCMFLGKEIEIIHVLFQFL